MPLVDPEMKKKFCWPCIIGGLIGVGMTPMLCFGIVCLSKGDEDMSCGPGGTVRPRPRAHPRARLRAPLSRAARAGLQGGGISMTVMSAFIIGYLMVRPPARPGPPARSLTRPVRCARRGSSRTTASWSSSSAGCATACASWQLVWAPRGDEYRGAANLRAGSRGVGGARPGASGRSEGWWCAGGGLRVAADAGCVCGARCGGDARA